MMWNKGIFVVCVIGHLVSVGCKKSTPQSILSYQDYKHYVDDFNQNDNELYKQYIPNAEVHSFLAENIPLVDLPDKTLEKIYYFRWWTYRKHVKHTQDGFVITEFLPDVSWAGKYNTINCPAAHHIYEGRWLRNPEYMHDYLHFWLTGAGKGVRSYSFWIANAMWGFQKVNPNDSFLGVHLPLLQANYQAWESERKDPGMDLFWQVDDRDGMEFSASGRLLNDGVRKGSMAAVRPTINSYMYGDAKAISEMAAYLDQTEIAEAFKGTANILKEAVQNRLWNDSLQFFTVMPRTYNSTTAPLNIREIIGYTPWYFNLPDDTPEHAIAWVRLLDTTGFYAPFGLTVCERSHPYFEISYEGHACQWNGPSWPFSTTITLKALANFLNNYHNHGELSSDSYNTLLKQYAKSHAITMEDGTILPWIDENLNPFSGDWIARTRLKENENSQKENKVLERGKDYNHSGFCDLIISDLIGLKPSSNPEIIVQPLIDPAWDWFCLDNVMYHGKPLSIIWDRDGKRYSVGRGMHIYYDGEKIYTGESLKPVQIKYNF